MKAILIVVLAFASGMLFQQMITVPTDGYKTIRCKKVDQRGDTIVVENTMIKTR